jgi:hypothetical protein
MSDKKRQSLLKGLEADTTDSKKYVQSSFKKSIEWQQVSSIADRLLIWCNDKSVREKIAKANLPETNSKEVQNVLLPKAKDLGFSSEAKGLFSDYKTSALRPDYYCAIGTSGIILEVERGQTTANNNDLRNFWKCHICKEANYLFLFVPKELRHNYEMTPRNQYEKVKNRLESFFTDENYTNVRGLVIFGY